ncbi:hypothetical protein ABZV29_08870 [Streptomyces sp. NPDC005236]|uniref:hypothetical protein n=1 Tax=Streptomyces sp. NPDC005236 TaxID=3157028 RepID=UPI00339FE6EC
MTRAAAVEQRRGPEYALALPENALVLLHHVLAMPEHALAMPEHVLAMPEHALAPAELGESARASRARAFRAVIGLDAGPMTAFSPWSGWGKGGRSEPWISG